MMSFVLVLLLFFGNVLADSQKSVKGLNQPIEAIQKTHQDAKNSQKRIDKWDDETKNSLAQYRTTLTKTENLKIYNTQMSNYIEAQKKELLDIRKKIEQVKDTGQEIVPLMLRMLKSLKQFIDLDTPFLLTERKKRMQELTEILDRSDVSVSEKYRQLISAYKLELDYGRTLQSYRELREIDGKEITVDYVRLGRLIFYYRSLDGHYMGYWNTKNKAWEKLPNSYKKSAIKGIKMANKQIPPNLLRLPIARPTSNSKSGN